MSGERKKHTPEFRDQATGLVLSGGATETCARLPEGTLKATTGRGATVWLTGLPSAGKSTIARALADRLRFLGLPVEVLDGDHMRTRLCAGLGFDRTDRDANVLRVGWVARMLAKHGVIVLVPVIAPYTAARAQLAEEHEAEGVEYLEIYVETSLEICTRRDVKGLFALQRAGKLSGLTGVDDPYEAPVSPSLRVDTANCSVVESVELVFDLLTTRRLV